MPSEDVNTIESLIREAFELYVPEIPLKCLVRDNAPGFDRLRGDDISKTYTTKKIRAYIVTGLEPQQADRFGIEKKDPNPVIIPIVLLKEIGYFPRAGDRLVYDNAEFDFLSNDEIHDSRYYNYNQFFYKVYQTIKVANDNPFAYTTVKTRDLQISVVDSITGDPIAGAKVFIEDVLGSDKYTNSNGVVIYTALPARQMRLGVLASGYNSGELIYTLVAGTDIAITTIILVGV